MEKSEILQVLIIYRNVLESTVTHAGPGARIKLCKEGLAPEDLAVTWWMLGCLPASLRG